MLRRKTMTGAGVLALVLAAGAGHAVPVHVTVTNVSPENGTFLTPVWVGFHDGTFDLYNQGEPILQPGLEALAEDGNNAPLSSDFANSGSSVGNADTSVGMGPIAPGATVRTSIDVDPSNQFFSYASMVIPSNDTFIANGNPQAFEVFDDAGRPQPVTFRVPGLGALDAGTEVNDELPVNTAFFGQTTPDTGVDENGVVALATGFNAPGSGGILDAAMFADADYTAEGYEFVEVTVAPVPVPAPIALLLGGVAVLIGLRRRAA